MRVEVVDRFGRVLGLVNRTTFTDACSEDGDSGGPWVLGTMAIGIHSAGSACGRDQIAAFVPIDQVMADLPGVQVLTVQPQVPTDLRITSLSCRNSPPGSPTIRCFAAWEGGRDPVTAHWSVFPDTQVGVNTDPLIKRSLMQFTCNTTDNDIWFEYEVTLVVVDDVGRMASYDALVPCIAPW
jgi:hypothetical protein